MTTTEVYDKTSGILAAIQQCGCDHCLNLIKKGIGNQPIPTDDTTNPVTKPNRICLE